MNSLHFYLIMQVVKRKRTDTDGEQSSSYNSSVRNRFGTHGDVSVSSYSKKFALSSDAVQFYISFRLNCLNCYGMVDTF